MWPFGRCLVSNHFLGCRGLLSLSSFYGENARHRTKHQQLRRIFFFIRRRFFFFSLLKIFNYVTEDERNLFKSKNSASCELLLRVNWPSQVICWSSLLWFCIQVMVESFLFTNSNICEPLTQREAGDFSHWVSHLQCNWGLQQHKLLTCVFSHHMGITLCRIWAHVWQQNHSCVFLCTSRSLELCPVFNQH